MELKHLPPSTPAAEPTPAAPIAVVPPAPTPQEPPAPVEPTTTTDGPDWAALSIDVDGVAVEEPTPVDPGTPPPAPETPPVDPAAEPIQPEPVAPEPETPPPQEPAVLTDEQRKAALDAYRIQLEKVYSFDDETAMRLQTEPEKVLPQLAARLHMDLLQMMQAQIAQAVPQIIHTQTDMSRRENTAKQLFFNAWPELKGYDKQIIEVGAVFRKMNPNVDADTAVKRIGEITMAALGITRVAPQAPTSPTTPARPVNPGRVTAPAAAPTVWDEMVVDDN